MQRRLTRSMSLTRAVPASLPVPSAHHHSRRAHRMRRSMRSLLRTPLVAALALVLSFGAATGLVVGASAPAYAATYPTLAIGSTGANVTSLQHLLTSRGYSTAADGDFGSGTKAAVQAFQRSRGLTADGIAGPTTFGAARQPRCARATTARRCRRCRCSSTSTATPRSRPTATSARPRTPPCAASSRRNGLGRRRGRRPGHLDRAARHRRRSGGGTPGTTYASLSDGAEGQRPHDHRRRQGRRRSRPTAG